jgi:hypothetical protein
MTDRSKACSTLITTGVFTAEFRRIRTLLLGHMKRPDTEKLLMSGIVAEMGVEKVLALKAEAFAEGEPSAELHTRLVELREEFLYTVLDCIMEAELEHD